MPWLPSPPPPGSAIPDILMGLLSQFGLRLAFQILVKAPRGLETGGGAPFDF